MIKAEDAKRITRNTARITDFIANTESQILRAAMEGKSSTIRALSNDTKKADLIKKILIDAGYSIDDRETTNGVFKPGVVVKISWD